MLAPLRPALHGYRASPGLAFLAAWRRTTELARAPLKHWHSHPRGVPGTADRLGDAGIDGKDIDQPREGKNPQLQVLRAARIRRRARALARLRRVAAWSWLSPGLPAVSAPCCFDAAQEGAQAGDVPLAAVADPDVLAEGGQGGEAAGRQ
jgi:hypothetical protein